MMILYFTATGNSLFVAKKIGGKTCSIVQAVRNKQFIFEDDVIGIVFPVYGLCVPPYVRKFLEQSEFTCRYLFGIITYGVHQGAVVKDLMDIKNRNSRPFDYINTIRMTETCLSKFEMKHEIMKSQNKDFEQAFSIILEDIKQNRHWILRNSIWEEFLTGVHKKMYPYPIGLGAAGKFYVEESCNHCGTCAHVCPMNNIKLSEWRPSFGTKCISCQACTQNCPANAIRLSDEKSTKRYRHSDITLEEIIAANK